MKQLQQLFNTIPHLEIFKFILKSKKPITKKLNYIRIVKILGFDVNGKDDDGYTPLHIAASEGLFEVVQLLLELEADPNGGTIIKDIL